MVPGSGGVSQREGTFNGQERTSELQNQRAVLVLVYYLGPFAFYCLALGVEDS